jgi:hypothetical protein
MSNQKGKSIIVEVRRLDYKDINRDLLTGIAIKHKIALAIIDEVLLQRNRDSLGDSRIIGEGELTICTSNLRIAQEALSSWASALLLIVPDSGKSISLVVCKNIKNVLQAFSNDAESGGDEDVNATMSFPKSDEQGEEKKDDSIAKAFGDVPEI